MTAKPKKTKRKKIRKRPGRVGRLRASMEEDVRNLLEGESREEARWNRPRKQQISLRLDTEVVDWFKSRGAGYQTRINRILRRVMMGEKKRER
ncbi:MAG TPA: BrnA antitoxin family protein [Terriglobales bacterium]|nr:BrnA antitoxin family protein [Terriglobales bacterium]